MGSTDHSSNLAALHTPQNPPLFMGPAGTRHKKKPFLGKDKEANLPLCRGREVIRKKVTQAKDIQFHPG